MSEILETVGSETAGGSQSSALTAQAHRWRKWLATLLGVPAGLSIIAVAGIVLMDPFSTGRLTPIKRIDIATNDVLLGHAGRVRDPRYDAAVIGNSHAILLDPARLSTTMHLRVVQLAFPALVPPEQFIIARAFLRHHPKAAALIIVLDNDSCGATDPIPNWYFPTYLFEGSEFDYLKNIFSSAALEATAYRSLMLLGLADSPGRPDGFSIFDFPANRRSGRLSRIANMKRPTQGPGVGSPLPALDRLEGFAAGLDPETALLLYFAPAPATTLPLPDSAAAQWLDACKARYRAVAASRPRTVLLDRMTDDDFTQDIDNFEDSEHLRNDLAPMLEHEIEAALRPLLASRVNGESGPE